MSVFVIAFASIVCSVAAQFLLKMGLSQPALSQAMGQPFSAALVLAIFSSPYILSGFTLYGAGAIVWLKVLAVWDVSKAYPIVGLGFVLTMLIGLCLGESVTPFRLLGAALICQGIWLMTLS